MYLTYDEYTAIGGALDLTAFNRYIGRVCAEIDIYTHGRIKTLVDVPTLVKTVCADLLDYMQANKAGKAVTSRSQSAGGVSESESYAVKTSEQCEAEIEGIIAPLASITTPSGVSLLYKGAAL